MWFWSLSRLSRCASNNEATQAGTMMPETMFLYKKLPM